MRSSSPARRTIRLADGRDLLVAAYGPPDGHPVLYCHGTPSSHAEWEVFGDDELLSRLRLRIIAPDRPGMGGSSFQWARTLADWPDDAAAALSTFAIDRFSVLGYSGGGAYAAAAALAFASRVDALALVAAPIHMDEDMEAGLDPRGLSLKHLARDRPWLASLILNLAMGATARFAPQRLKATMLSSLPGPDADALLEDGRIDRLVGVLREAFRHGGRGAARDMALLVTPWSAALRPPSFPVDIWQGDLDTFGARPAMAVHLASRLGTDRLHLLPEGHVSIFTRHIEAILAPLGPAA